MVWSAIAYVICARGGGNEARSGLLHVVDLFCTVSQCGAGTVCEQCANTN